MKWTRAGIVRQRVRIFTEMTRHGATVQEAMAYIDLIWPLEHEWRLRYREGHRFRRSN